MAIFTAKKLPEIDINGNKYPILLGEVDVLERSAALMDRASELRDNGGDAHSIIDTCRAMEAYVNDLCGAGAMKKMVGDTPMTIADTVRLLTVINGEVGAAFAVALAEAYA